MTPEQRLEAAAQKWADTVNDAIETRVQLALALERDRHDAQLAALEKLVLDSVVALARTATAVGEHSMRVEP